MPRGTERRRGLLVDRRGGTGAAAAAERAPRSPRNPTFLVDRKLSAIDTSTGRLLLTLLSTMQSDADEALGRHQIRQQKLRITRYVEDLVPAPVLQAGALIMVMQVDSPVNGSMYHTVISIVFPLPEEDGTQFIHGIKESGEGGTFRTTIYRPLIDVTRDDVFDAFPEQFPGGRRTMERLAYRARDMAIAQIEQEMERVIRLKSERL